MILRTGCRAAREGPEQTSDAAGLGPSALASVLDGGPHGGHVRARHERCVRPTVGVTRACYYMGLTMSARWSVVSCVCVRETPRASHDVSSFCR